MKRELVAAGLLFDRPDNVGVIGVAVFRKRAEPAARIGQSVPWPEPPFPADAEDSPFPGPADAAAEGDTTHPLESAAARLDSSHPQMQGKSSSLGTGHGRSRVSRVTYASFERATPGPEEVIAIHYDTYDDLAALGVIQAPRIATPFPGQFVPDPR